ncbi:ABC transporter permease [Levilactobacillus namurensis]|uniref:ABC transporter permease n=1 Tax=Levilactobacillus namurensis TaxID=380393 RepID=UPI0026EC3D64|nr:ABC transporter permease [Levilactobacillus namurensis]
MRTSIAMESYKFWHQKASLYGILVLLGLMSYSAITTKVGPKQWIFEFGATQWIVIILLAVGSSFWSMEYQNHTITLLLYKQVNRRIIYGAKLVVILLYGVALTCIATLVTFILKFLMVGQRYDWLTTQINQRPLITELLLNVCGTLIYACFIVTLASLLIMLIRINAAVIGIGLAIGFLGAGISVALMAALTPWSGILKWGPLNMIFITQQLSNPSYTQISHLTNPAIMGGTLAYAALFTWLGYLLFKHRHV